MHIVASVHLSSRSYDTALLVNKKSATLAFFHFSSALSGFLFLRHAAHCAWLSNEHPYWQTSSRTLQTRWGSTCYSQNILFCFSALMTIVNKYLSIPFHLILAFTVGCKFLDRAGIVSVLFATVFLNYWCLWSTSICLMKEYVSFTFSALINKAWPHHRYIYYFELKADTQMYN